MKLSVAVLLISLILSSVSMGEVRDFTNKEGKTIQGELVDLRDGKVRLRVSGRIYDVPVETLSPEDQTWLNEWDLKRQGKTEELYYSDLIFEDDFSGGGFKEEWGHYASSSLIEDGVLVGKTTDIKVHAGVDNIRFEGRKDMEVSVKFKFAGPTAYRFNVWFDDKELKEAHAGHVCSVAVSPKEVSIQDAKTGNMRLDIREKRQAGEQLDDETMAMLAEKMVKFPVDLEGSDDWHELLIRTKDDVVTVSLDGDELGELQSEGLAHPTKSLVSLTTNEDDVHYDDFVVKAAPAE
ncbi:MAG: hypothetical protein P1U58_20035 [Verrucomicrobiales bacterium]|nr:hypothetical protein [Verrucomicrobiales bacterium]